MSTSHRSLLLTAAVMLVALLSASAALAAPVVINTPFMNLEHRAVNSLGFGSGTFLRIGANAVTPNGNAGTTGVGTTTHLVTGALVSRTINFRTSSAATCLTTVRSMALGT
jgi:hypothetical protein